MAANSANILAGVGPAALAWFAAADTPGPIPVAGTDGVQTVTISGTPTGGDFTLTWNGYTTSELTAGSSLPTTAAVQTALQALPGGSGITVTGTAGSSYVCTFPKAGVQVAMTASGSFTGGSTPSITVAQTTAGVQTTTMATADIPADFTTAGWCDPAGLSANVNETINTVNGYGTTQALRKIVQNSERSFDVTFLETNPVTNAIYNRLAIASIVPSAAGAWDIEIGAPVTQTYAGIFDVADGGNHLRSYCPRLQVSSIKTRTISAGKEIPYGVTLTAVPDVSGVAVYESYVVAGLAV